MSKQQRILVRSPNWIGDHVMAMPFYRGLKDLYPEAQLTLLCPEALVGLPVSEVFSEVIVLSAQQREFPQGGWRAGQKLRAGNYNMGISLPASWSSAFLLWAARIPVRVGFCSDGCDLLLTDAMPWLGRSSGKHKSQLYLSLLPWLSGKPLSRDLAKISTQGTHSAKENTIIVCPGASIALREWPYFSELLVALRQKYLGYRILVVGGKREEKWQSQLKRWGSGIEDWITKTSLSELCDVMKTASIVIANDSGLAHVSASLARAPTLVLMGPGDPKYILPEGDSIEGLRVSLPCSPCERAVCTAPFGYQKCLRELSVATVLEAVDCYLTKAAS